MNEGNKMTYVLTCSLNHPQFIICSDNSLVVSVGDVNCSIVGNRLIHSNIFLCRISLYWRAEVVTAIALTSSGHN